MPISERVQTASSDQVGLSASLIEIKLRHELLHIPIASRSNGMTNILSNSGLVRLPPPLEALLGPDAYTHLVTQLQVGETHISWVILIGPFAYKIKKPVRFDDRTTASLLATRTPLNVS